MYRQAFFFAHSIMEATFGYCEEGEKDRPNEMDRGILGRINNSNKNPNIFLIIPKRENGNISRNPDSEATYSRECGCREEC